MNNPQPQWNLQSKTIDDPRTRPGPREQLREHIMGFRITQMIHVAARLGLADRLSGGPRTPRELAAASGADESALYRLLRALASIGIFAEEASGAFVLTPQAELLRTDAPGSLHNIAVMFGGDWLWPAYGEMLHAVLTGRPGFLKAHGQPLYSYLQEHPRAAARFNAAMSGYSASELGAILEAYDFSTARYVVDVGGGHGFLIAGLLRAHPHLSGTLFDLPSVVAGAKRLPDEPAIAGRLDCRSGDFFDEIPAGGDLYVMKSVLHNWDDVDAARILATCRAAMSASARLVLIERVVPEGNEPSEAKLFDINMLTAVGGRERTEREFRLLLQECGLKFERLAATRSPLSMIVARASAA